MNNDLSRKALISCFLEACLEIYDFTIFGFLAPVIHKNYLSFMDEKAALVITYAFFAIGFVVRPIGSLIFGYIGDVHGRKKALVLSVSFMGLASLSMSLLPPYIIIGLWSCYLIALIRVVQGLSVGGEYSGAIIYAMEHYDSKQAGKIGGIVVAGCLSGVLLATVVSKIVQSSFMPEYSWRFSFLLGFGLSMIGYFIRKRLVETPDFLASTKSKGAFPLLEGARLYSRECFGAIGVSAANGINFYLILVFFPGFVNGLIGEKIDYFPIITTFVLVILSPMFSFLSDSVGRVRMLSYGLIGSSLWGVVGVQLLIQYPTKEFAIMFFVIQAIIASPVTGTANVFVVEIFPVRYRYSCSALCYSLGMGIVGGTSPMVASLITNSYSNSGWLLSLYMSLIPILGFVSMLMARRQRD